ncbi:MAG: type I glyceraldehyde-3-phosphate dehydrogenase [Bdellovibrionales bacterium]|nr:type I glyceraldehyde-3-phosphate dehydrogenase [Bdellovibrionales bacterium]
MSRLRVAINGFGRIGRIVFRAGFEHLDIVAVNDPGGSEIGAHLLKYDSTHGTFNKSVSADGKVMNVDGKQIHFLTSRNPLECDWKGLGVDVVLECSGVFKDKSEIEAHIKAGAKRVIVSAPAKKVDLTVVYGINHEAYDPSKHYVVSNASCTTNCLAPLAKVINEAFEIEKALMTTVHAYTNDQKILDSAHKDFRRARSAALSMIPTTTGAAVAVTEVLPELKGKLDGTSIRVPTPNVSVVDLTAQVKNKVTKESINEALKKAAAGSLKGVLTTEDNELVSIDFNGNTHSSIVDLPSTMVIGDNLLKVFSWYDNETGFSNRMIDFALHMQKKGI